VCGSDSAIERLRLLGCLNKRRWNIFTALVLLVWDVPADDILFEHNPDWFLHALTKINETQRAMFLMLLLRVWHVHNELTHQKKPTPVEASKRFLMSYMESLMLIKHHLEVNLEKDKHVISCVQGFRQ
jgi:hypothetical protein